MSLLIPITISSLHVFSLEHKPNSSPTLTHFLIYLYSQSAEQPAKSPLPCICFWTTACSYLRAGKRMTSGEKPPSPKIGAHFDLPPPALKSSLGKKPAFRYWEKNQSPVMLICLSSKNHNSKSSCLNSSLSLSARLVQCCIMSYAVMR